MQCLKNSCCICKRKEEEEKNLCIPRPQVGPVKLVELQSQMKRFQPSIHFPPCIQGFSEHFGGIIWQDDLMEPES